VVAPREREGRKHEKAEVVKRCASRPTDWALSCERERLRSSPKRRKAQCQTLRELDWNALWLGSCSALVGGVPQSALDRVSTLSARARRPFTGRCLPYARASTPVASRARLPGSGTVCTVYDQLSTPC
jgi:hypothetical protein